MLLGSCAGSRPEPIERLFAVNKPLCRKDGRSLNCFLASVGKAGRHQKREAADPGRSVTRNDVSITRLHHTGTERVLELGCVDEKAIWPPLFRFRRKEAERGFKA